jgi:hypothetical protein
MPTKFTVVSSSTKLQTTASISNGNILHKLSFANNLRFEKNNQSKLSQMQRVLSASCFIGSLSTFYRGSDVDKRELASYITFVQQAIK